MLQQPYNIEYRLWKTSTTTIPSLSSIQSNTSTCILNTNYESIKDINEKKQYLKSLYTSSPPDWADSLICTCSS